ncbi:hypothetical protein [Actinacidiphila acidipaludis]|uniref:Integral membrane protein n=1 Tax=Actinacidiphila acidipaludis TaxID=2873382 RepID=A0ABS7Q7C9_9ACTN|nr:hypothetical protein [Streptomyces acidipaludis]MBY8879055.1 hypothetical protein [Streptomyces acidipaludis]
MTDRLSAPARPVRRRGAVLALAAPWPVAAVCAVFVAAQLALTVRGSGLGWDETVYTSQVSGHVPAAFFSAPRARGVTFLAAPVAALTASTAVLRLWMALLSGAGLFAAFWPWRRLLPPRVLALAAGLFAGLWITLFYGPQVMPNLWSAYGALGATGCLMGFATRGRAPGPGRVAGERRWPGGGVRGSGPETEYGDAESGREAPGPAAGEPGLGGPARGAAAEAAGPGFLPGVPGAVPGTGHPGRVAAGLGFGGLGRAAGFALAGLAAGVAVAGLMRPPDAVWLAAGLGCAAAVLARGWRVPVFAALAAGLVLGCAEWVVEAYASYGGLSERLHRASAIQGGLGWHVAFGDQLRALDGRTLCRPCDVPWRHRVTAAWWLLLPFAAAAGAAVAPRGRRAAVVVPAVTAVFVAAPYLLTVGYAAPRFLLPAYALLALPVAECLRWLVMAPGGRWRPLPTALVALALCGHLAVQLGVLHGVTRNNRVLSGKYAAVAARLHSHGVRPPCVLSGDNAVPIAYYSGCASRQTGGPDRSVDAAGLAALARREAAAYLLAAGSRTPAFAVAWPCVPLPLSPEPGGERACVAPRPAPR